MRYTWNSRPRHIYKPHIEAWLFFFMKVAGVMSTVMHAISLERQCNGTGNSLREKAHDNNEHISFYKGAQR